MYNKVLSLFLSPMWIGYLFVVNQLDVLYFFQLYAPVTGLSATVASFVTIAVLSLYFLLLGLKVLIPLAYFAFSFSIYFKMVSFGFVGSSIYYSFAFLSLYGLERYIQMLQAKFHWLLFLVYGEVQTLGFLLELVLETIKPFFSSKLLDSGNTSFTSDQIYRNKAQQFFELTEEPVKVVFVYVSEKLTKIYEEFSREQKEQEKVIIVEEPEFEFEFEFEFEPELQVLKTTPPLSSCFLFELEMEHVFGDFNTNTCTIDDVNVIEFPLHGLGVFFLLGLKCFLVKK